MPHEADCGLRADYVASSAVFDQWLALMREVIATVKTHGGDEVDVYEEVMVMVQDRIIADVQDLALGRPARALSLALIRCVELSTVDTIEPSNPPRHPKPTDPPDRKPDPDPHPMPQPNPPRRS